METYIQTLRKLSKKTSNIKSLVRRNILEEYLMEVSTKIQLGFKLDDRILNQEVLKKHNTLKIADELTKSSAKLKLHLAEMRKQIPYKSIGLILKSMKYIGYNETFRLSNDYSFIIDRSGYMKIYYKHYILDKRSCVSFNIDSNRNYIDHQRLAA